MRLRLERPGAQGGKILRSGSGVSAKGGTIEDKLVNSSNSQKAHV